MTTFIIFNYKNKLSWFISYTRADNNNIYNLIILYYNFYAVIICKLFFRLLFGINRVYYVY